MLFQRSHALEIRTDLRVLVGATLGAAINFVSVFVYTVSVFFEAMREDLGWSLKQEANPSGGRGGAAGEALCRRMPL